MQPFKRKRRARRDMITLGGWLFADLLLGLSMLFLVANTVGAPPPEPTPTPLPDYLATADAEIAARQAEADQTAAAYDQQIIILQGDQDSAQATIDANATYQAMNEDERATEQARSALQAANAQATIDAQATQQALDSTNQSELNNQLATTVAEATEVARQVEANSTEQAELRNAATENAQSGSSAQGTNEAVESDLATNEAQLNTSRDAESTAQANADQAQANAANAQSTSDAAQNELRQAQEQAQLNTLNPNAIPETINVDINGVLSGDDDAVQQAERELDRVLSKYEQSESCRIGFVLISSGADDISRGVQLSERIGRMIQEEHPDLLPVPPEGQDPALASESIALIGSTPNGEVELLLFMSAGCQAEG